jgi:hypothetical protein
MQERPTQVSLSATVLLFSHDLGRILSKTERKMGQITGNFLNSESNLGRRLDAPELMKLLNRKFLFQQNIKFSKKTKSHQIP